MALLRVARESIWNVANVVGNLRVMDNKQPTGVVCQWCERVIREGGESVTLVTCLDCAQTFGASFHRDGSPTRRSRTAATESHERTLTAAR